MLDQKNMSAPALHVPPNSGKPGFASNSRILSMTAKQAHGLDYFLYCPPNTSPVSPLLVSIHGHTRNVAEHAFRLAPIAREHNAVLVVPHFSRKRFPHFNYLQPDANGIFPGDALDTVLTDAKLRLGMASNEVFLFGYSAGAQFGHRYLMLSGKRISRAALFAPGWFTWPITELAFPQGLGPSDALHGRNIKVKNLGKTDICVFVGKNDIRRDRSLNTKPKIDRIQGKSRLERAERWVPAVNKKLPETHQIQLNVLNGVGHDFKNNIVKNHIDQSVFNWLLNSTPPH